MWGPRCEGGVGAAPSKPLSSTGGGGAGWPEGFSEGWSLCHPQERATGNRASMLAGWGGNPHFAPVARTVGELI